MKPGTGLIWNKKREEGYKRFGEKSSTGSNIRTLGEDYINRIRIFQNGDGVLDQWTGPKISIMIRLEVHRKVWIEEKERLNFSYEVLPVHRTFSETKKGYDPELERTIIVDILTGTL